MSNKALRAKRNAGLLVGDKRFRDTYVVYQNHKKDAICSIGVYNKFPTKNDNTVSNGAAIVVRHNDAKFGNKMYALVPELGTGAVVSAIGTSNEHVIASTVLPDPVIMAALGSMSKDL